MMECSKQKISNVISTSYKLRSTAHDLLIIVVRPRNIHPSPLPDADARDLKNEASKEPMRINEAY